MKKTTSHVQRLGAKNASVSSGEDTFFGLAELMLKQLEDGKFHKDMMEQHGTMQPILVADDIAIAQGARGVEKIHASSAIALQAINNELNATGLHLNAGYKNEGDKVKFWIDEFDPKKVDFNAARATVQKFKKILEPAQDPTVDYPELPKRPGGSHWMGPVNRQNSRVLDAVMGLMLDFHNIKSIDSRTLNMPDGTFYVDCDKAQMEDLMRKEGLLPKVPTLPAR